MQLLAPAPDGGDEIRRLQQGQMLGDCLPLHVEKSTQLSQRLPVVLVQLIEQLSTAFISQRFEYCIHLAASYATKWLHVKRDFYPGIMPAHYLSFLRLWLLSGPRIQHSGVQPMNPADAAATVIKV
jgi:hypothetical protein